MNKKNEVGIRAQELEKINMQLQQANEELARREADLAETNRLLRNEIKMREAVEGQLRNSNSFLNSIVENIPHMIFVKEANGLRFEQFNTAGERLLGYRREELLGRNDYDMFPKAQAEFFTAKDREVLENKQLLDIPEESVQTRFGNRILHTKKIPILDATGHPKYLLGISEDITEKKRVEHELRMLNENLELRVAERTAAAEERARELAHSNSELERFAYLASHDLQEPLRMVTSYVQLLERRYGDKLDATAHEFIQFAVDGAVRMKKLINGLLEYSRIGRTEKALHPIDTKAVLDQVLLNLTIALQEKNATVRYSALPHCLGDPVLLADVFQNLIGNALKFCTAKDPIIRIDARPQGDSWVFEVSDNGIGIDPKHAGRIFEIFQRLHPTDKYPGAGIGLAICKKIIELHGGKIWVESRLGAGSHFFFTLRGSNLATINNDQQI